MSKFRVIRTLDLSDIEGWDGCFLKMSDPNTGDVMELQRRVKDNEEDIEAVMNFLENCFVSGEGFDGEKKVEIKKTDIRELPLSVIRKVQSFLLQSTNQAPIF